MNGEDFQRGGDRFPLTRRSVIEAVRSIDEEERQRALEALCEAYWKPIYKYIRLRWNRPADQAGSGAFAVDKQECSGRLAATGKAISPRGDMPKNRVLFFRKDAACLLTARSPLRNCFV